MSIAFIDLQAQRRRIADRVDAAIANVLEHGRFVMGPEVVEFETATCRVRQRLPRALLRQWHGCFGAGADGV